MSAAPGASLRSITAQLRTKPSEFEPGPEARIWTPGGHTTAGSAQGRLEMARLRAEKLRQLTADHCELVAIAIEQADWDILGYTDLLAWYRDVAGFEHVRPRIRRRLVAALREQGWSFRRIGTELEVSKDTATRDLNDAKSGVSPETPQDRVTGKDGKSYPAVKPPRPQPQPEPQPEPQPHAPPVAWAVVINVLEVFARDVKHVLPQVPGGRPPGLDDAIKAARTAIEQIEQASA